RRKGNRELARALKRLQLLNYRHGFRLGELVPEGGAAVAPAGLARVIDLARLNGGQVAGPALRGAEGSADRLSSSCQKPARSDDMGTMVKFKSWLEAVERLEAGFHEAMLMEAAAHTSFQSPLPPELSFLTGRFVDLGFENLDFGPQRFNDFLRAFSGT